MARCRVDEAGGLSQCTVFSTADGLADDRVHGIVKGGDGHIYVGTKGGGVSRFDDPGFTPFVITAEGRAVDLYCLTATEAGELVIGTRTVLPEARAALLPQARCGNRLAVVLIGLLWGASYTDLGPFRAVSWEALERVGMVDRGFGWTVELQVKAARLGLRHAEVPVRYRVRRGGRSKVSGTVRGSLLATYAILFVTLRYAFRRTRNV